MEKVALKFNEDNLSLGDLEDFYEFTGVELSAAIKTVPSLDDDGNKVFDADGRPQSQVEIPTKCLIGLVWIILRQDRPGFTVDDARKVKVSSLDFDEGDGDEGKDQLTVVQGGNV